LPRLLADEGRGVGLSGVSVVTSKTNSNFVGCIVGLVYPDRTGEIYYTAHSSGQRWFYFSRMQPDEALLFKYFDSARDGRTRYTAHTGLANPHAPTETPPRQSIEVRTLLYFA
jgi:hypothetical protein